MLAEHASNTFFRVCMDRYSVSTAVDLSGWLEHAVRAEMDAQTTTLTVIGVNENYHGPTHGGCMEC